MTSTDLDVLDFKEFGKIARLNRDVVITEKIDGTNACIVIKELIFGVEGFDEYGQRTLAIDDHTGVYEVGAQSRSRALTVENDNYGFAKWVLKNKEALIEILGVGYHYGEWWGSGINRGYGLKNGEKRFSLFNVERWKDQVGFDKVEGLEVVPVLYQGAFSEEKINDALISLKRIGSNAVFNFNNPEGIVIWHEHARQLFKVTIENDDVPKSKVKQ